jgi:hypothetical protein
VFVVLGQRPWVPAMKAALKAHANIDLGPTRDPQCVKYSEEQIGEMRSEIKNILSKK